jgi:hypothetical protein
LEHKNSHYCPITCNMKDKVNPTVFLTSTHSEHVFTLSRSVAKFISFSLYCPIFFVMIFSYIYNTYLTNFEFKNEVSKRVGGLSTHLRKNGNIVFQV